MAAPKTNGGSTAAPTTTVTAVVARPQMQVNNPTDLLALADILYHGGMAPPGIDNPRKVAAVILAGMEVGLAPTQALGSIMVTNGRPSIYGDGAMALVRASGLLESIDEKVQGEGDERGATCRVKRRGEAEKIYTFSVADANRAGLIERARGKDGKGRGPWITYQDRMLTMRARGFAFRDVFADVLRGLTLYEEFQDSHADAVTVEAVKPQAPQATQPASPSANGTHAAPATTSSTPTLPVAQPVTEEQLAKIGEIRRMVMVSRGLTEPAEQKPAWAAILADYGVSSAREFTAAKAAEFIAAEWEKHDPFTTPAAPAVSTT